MKAIRVKETANITMSCSNGQLRNGKGFEIEMACSSGQLRNGKGVTELEVTMNCSNNQIIQEKRATSTDKPKSLIKTIGKAA